MIGVSLLVAQVVGLLVLLARLAPGRTRRPPVEPILSEISDTTVTVIVATLDEVRRIAPCLSGLRAQGRPLLEVLVVDSRSTDGTRELVERAASLDPRVRLLTDAPLPEGWVGKVWALQHGLGEARGEWVLGIDADTEPAPGMVAGAVEAARAADYSVVSFSPRFADQSDVEQLLQPALLVTLVYRGGVAGSDADAERVLANGQCFLARRDVLERHGGYESARASFADDVTLTRHLARRGERVGFLDGSRLYAVRSYSSAAEMWHEWGRSLDLKDATTRTRQWMDVIFLTLVQGAPLLTLVALLLMRTREPWTRTLAALAAINAALLGIRLLLLPALAGSYERPRWGFWLSWLADPAAVLRVLLSTLRRRHTWRGRTYPNAGAEGSARND